MGRGKWFCCPAAELPCAWRVAQLIWVSASRGAQATCTQATKHPFRFHVDKRGTYNRSCTCICTSSSNNINNSFFYTFSNPLFKPFGTESQVRSSHFMYSQVLTRCCAGTMASAAPAVARKSALHHTHIPLPYARRVVKRDPMLTQPQNPQPLGRWSGLPSPRCSKLTPPVSLLTTPGSGRCRTSRPSTLWWSARPVEQTREVSRFAPETSSPPWSRSRASPTHSRAESAPLPLVCGPAASPTRPR